MDKRTLQVARIGNSRGVRLPADTPERLGIRDSATMEEPSDGIPADRRVSFSMTSTCLPIT